ncbi:MULTISPECIES: MarR family transcriptional regulator [unclassified Dehalobacter]|uniref:MarR family winged helix-turn-helix transcriptional regulator n=2 Tax=Dehalobacter TaxID=56112 RepID=UPI000E6CF7CA|nr:MULTISPECIES: MarR family transcriptional regulator [unclassified Dehalobacter]RJE47867.1 MarR family transcriptional regulator [Dehalobacter sp. MCB1]TCX48980.1 MarR family transcriptional regulator [Dehalobacter sp. 14DCB1]TCX56698.1 MarR family transcriptional regulator [Dehalobacter sp. 12DCB1]
MSQCEAKEIQDLFFSLMGDLHEKFLCHFRKEYIGSAPLKKNHMKIINLLYHNEQLTLTKIAKKLDIEKGSLTTLIDQLTEWGLIIRSEDKNDRRKSLISLSSLGKTEMDTLMVLYEKRLNELMFTSDPEEMNQFMLSLRYVVQFMKKL